MLNKFNKDELISRLKSFDQELEIINIKCKIGLIGGAAFLLSGWIERATKDIDAYVLFNGNPKKFEPEIIKIANRYDINHDALIYAEEVIGPLQSEDEWTLLCDVKFNNLEVFIPSPNTLAITKLFVAIKRDDYSDITTKEFLRDVDIEAVKKHIDFLYNDPNGYLTKETYDKLVESYETWIEKI